MMSVNGYYRITGANSFQKTVFKKNSVYMLLKKTCPDTQFVVANLKDTGSQIIPISVSRAGRYFFVTKSSPRAANACCSDFRFISSCRLISFFQ